MTPIASYWYVGNNGFMMKTNGLSKVFKWNRTVSWEKENIQEEKRKNVMNPKNQTIDFKNRVFDYTTGMEQFLVGQVK